MPFMFGLFRIYSGLLKAGNRIGEHLFVPSLHLKLSFQTTTNCATTNEKRRYEICEQRRLRWYHVFFFVVVFFNLTKANNFLVLLFASLEVVTFPNGGNSQRKTFLERYFL